MSILYVLYPFLSHDIVKERYNTIQTYVDITWPKPDVFIIYHLNPLVLGMNSSRI